VEVTEPLLSELVSQGIAQRYMKVHLEDYFGEHKVLGSLQDWMEPSMGQVRQLIAEIILPLGSQTIHEKCQPCKSLLIYGPMRTGKTMLTRAIASEIGATFFNLSPKAILGKYDNSAKETSLMIKMVFDVAKDMQPAIIYIDEVEKVFKATKKKSKTLPSRIRKELTTQMKGVKPGTRILVIGNTSAPWECDRKGTNAFFNRFVYTVIPDYGSCQKIWRKIIEGRIGMWMMINFRSTTGC